MSCERISCQGWERVYCLKNREVEILVVADIGPRVISFSPTGGENQFYVVPEQAGKIGSDDPRLYGGHRLWAAPETPKTFVSDNEPVEVAISEESACFTARPYPGPEGAMLQNAIEISLHPAGAHCSVTHRIRNAGETACSLGPWAITMLRPGGKVIIPFAERRTLAMSSLLPEQALVFWPYTDLNDAQWSLRQNGFELNTKASKGIRSPKKFGIRSQASWAVYLRQQTLFLKRTRWQSQATYPDLGCNFEVYTDGGFLELESLGPLQHLHPGADLTHTEDWWLLENIEEGPSQNWLEEEIASRIPQLGAGLV